MLSCNYGGYKSNPQHTYTDWNIKGLFSKKKIFFFFHTDHLTEGIIDFINVGNLQNKISNIYTTLAYVEFQNW